MDAMEVFVVGSAKAVEVDREIVSSRFFVFACPNLKLPFRLSSASARGILAPKHSSACQISQAMSSQEKQILDLKAKCMEFSKLEMTALSAETEKRE